MLDADTDIGGPNTRFPETCHPALLDMRGEKPARALAYEAVIGAYWKPVYRYIRLRWHKSNEDAKDLTQAFFAFAVEKNLFQAFEKEKARFRTYLRTCLDRFLANQQRFAARQKRSGPSVPLDESLADGSSSSGASPEELFEREFARNMFAEAVEQLRTALRPVAFAVFERYDLAEPPDRPSYQQIAINLDIPVTSVTNHLALARRELRRLLLERLRPITRDESEMRRESRALFRQ